MPLTERIMEAIGLKTHEPVVEVRHTSHRTAETHSANGIACQHFHRAEHAERVSGGDSSTASGFPADTAAVCSACAPSPYLRCQMSLTRAWQLCGGL